MIHMYHDLQCRQPNKEKIKLLMSIFMHFSAWNFNRVLQNSAEDIK